jgi:hypothetical protein
MELSELSVLNMDNEHHYRDTETQEGHRQAVFRMNQDSEIGLCGICSGVAYSDEIAFLVIRPVYTPEAAAV